MRLKKNSLLNLNEIDVYIEDVAYNSDYFRVSRVPELLEAGKSSFLIDLAPDLMKVGSEIKVEVLDSAGNPVYVEYPKYLEGTSRRISIYVYPESYEEDSTAHGSATLTIVGEAVNVPNEWKGLYNVRWRRNVLIDPSLDNTAPIRFYKNPTANVVELRKPYMTRTWVSDQTGVMTIGTVSGRTAIQDGYTIEYDDVEYSDNFA